MDPDVPLVVAEVNPETIADARKGIIANPNCTTMAAMPVLKPLHAEAGLVRLIAATYQAVSGAGGAGVDELDKQVRQVVDQAAALTHDGSAVVFPQPEKFARPIAFNVLPFAGKLLDDGRFETDEEQKLRNESRKILGHPRPQGVGDVRPGARVHRALAVAERRVRPAAVGRAGHRAAGRRAGRRAERHPDAAAGRRRATRAYVGRIRQDEGVDGGRGLALFVSNDNLRKGAALNAVQIAELFLGASRTHRVRAQRVLMRWLATRARCRALDVRAEHWPAVSPAPL